jgi:hypothetical protein
MSYLCIRITEMCHEREKITLREIFVFFMNRRENSEEKYLKVQVKLKEITGDLQPSIIMAL